MLDNEINAPFLLNVHGDPHFLFYEFNENNVLNN